MAAGARLLAEDDNVGDATNKLLLDLDETAAMLGLKRQTLARMSRRGLIPRVKLGRELSRINQPSQIPEDLRGNSAAFFS